MVWATSDQHWSHSNIIRLCNRPFADVHEMNKALTDNWNSVVQPHDIVYHLGDFSFKQKYHIYEDKLNGKIFHIKGNHDREKWPEFAQIEYNDTVLWLQHRPIESVHQISGDADIVICGHVHEKWKRQILENEGRKIPIINVSVEQWNYKPISIDHIINLANEICQTSQE